MQQGVHAWFTRGAVLAATFLAAACVRKPAPAGDSAASAPPADSPAPSAATHADSSSAIELRTDRPTYRAGDNATLTIVNHTKQKWTFNPCTRTLERESGTTWRVIPEGRMCTMEAWILAPEGTRTAQTSFGGSLDAGRYRLVIGFASAGAAAKGSVRATSAPVTISK
jgi:hypothetical protein